MLESLGIWIEKFRVALSWVAAAAGGELARAFEHFYAVPAMIVAAVVATYVGALTKRRFGSARKQLRRFAALARTVGSVRRSPVILDRDLPPLPWLPIDRPTNPADIVFHSFRHAKRLAMYLECLEAISSFQISDELRRLETKTEDRRELAKALRDNPNLAELAELLDHIRNSQAFLLLAFPSDGRVAINLRRKAEHRYFAGRITGLLYQVKRATETEEDVTFWMDLRDDWDIPEPNGWLNEALREAIAFEESIGLWPDSCHPNLVFYISPSEEYEKLILSFEESDE